MSKKWFSIALSVLLCLLSFAGCSFSPAEPVLSEEEVETLRDEYPDQPISFSPVVDIDTSGTVEQMAATMDTAVYGKVISPRKWKNVSTAGTDHPELEEKKENLTSGAGTATFLCYEMEVVRDAGGKYKKGDKVVFSITEMLEDTIPDFQEGDGVIFLGAYFDGKENALENEIATTFKGIYYVTDDGYALSTCGEDPQTARASGMTADDCLDLLYHLTQK